MTSDDIFRKCLGKPLLFCYSKWCGAPSCVRCTISASSQTDMIGLSKFSSMLKYISAFILSWRMCGLLSSLSQIPHHTMTEGLVCNNFSKVKSGFIFLHAQLWWLTKPPRWNTAFSDYRSYHRKLVSF